MDVMVTNFPEKNHGNEVLGLGGPRLVSTEGGYQNLTELKVRTITKDSGTLNLRTESGLTGPRVR